MPVCPVPTLEAQKRSAAESGSGYLPFKRPAGVDDTPLPAVYDTLDVTHEFPDETGMFEAYEQWWPVMHVSYARYYLSMDAGVTFVANTVENTRLNGLGNNEDDVGCIPVGTFPFPNKDVDDFPKIFDADNQTFDCDDGGLIRTYLSNHYTRQQGSRTQQAACPVPFSSHSEYFVNTTKDADKDIDTLSDPITHASVVAEVDAAYAAADWATHQGAFDFTFGSWPAIGDFTWPDCGEGNDEFGNYDRDGGGSVRKVGYRFRFEIPSTFDMPPAPAPQKWHGTYQSIDYQTVFTPADHDTENPEVSPKVITPGNVVWTGPGDLADDESWRTAWIEIPVPATEGETTVELVQSKCRHSMAMVKH